MEYFDEINNAGCGFLLKLEETGSNSLLIRIGTTKVSDVEEFIEVSGKK